MNTTYILQGPLDTRNLTLQGKAEETAVFVYIPIDYWLSSISLN